MSRRETPLITYIIYAVYRIIYFVIIQKAVFNYALKKKRLLNRRRRRRRRPGYKTKTRAAVVRPEPQNPAPDVPEMSAGGPRSKNSNRPE